MNLLEDLAYELRERSTQLFIAIMAILAIALYNWGGYAFAKIMDHKYDTSFETSNARLSESLSKSRVLVTGVERIRCTPAPAPKVSQPATARAYECAVKTALGSEYTSIWPSVENAAAAKAADLAFTIVRDGEEVEVSLQVNPEKLSSTKAEAFIRYVAAEIPLQTERERQRREAEALAALPESQRNRKSWD